jgi:hypothetical protein
MTIPTANPGIRGVQEALMAILLPPWLFVQGSSVTRLDVVNVQDV